MIWRGRPVETIDATTRALIDEIEQHRPALAGDIAHLLIDEHAPSVSPEELVPARSRNGDWTMQLASRWVHSRFNPRQEAVKRYQRLSEQEQGDGFVLVGIGLGYFLNALGATRREPVVAVVFSPDLLRAALSIRPAEWWRSVGPDRIVPAWLPGVIPVVLRDLGITNPIIVPLDAVTAYADEPARRVLDTLHYARERNEVNRNTLRRFGKLWVRNGIRNLAVNGALPGIERLEGVAAELPALVCGAGPTLDALRDTINELATRHVIIAVDTAVSVLQRWGISPHVAVVSDPQYWNSRHLDRVTLKETLLVAEPATHPRSFRLWRGPVLISASLFPLGMFFDTRHGRARKLGAGGSVATSAWDLARLLGARDIALAGVDLAFPDNQTHCADSFFENRLRNHADRLSPAEHGMTRYLQGADPQPVPAAGGGTVMSDRRMAIYRSWFTEQVHRFPEISTVVLSPAGSAITGISLETPIQRIARLPDISDRLDLVAGEIHRHATPIPARPARAPMVHAEAQTVLSDLRAEIVRIMEIATEGIAACSAAAAPDVALLHDLDEIDARLSSAEFRELAGFLANDALAAEIGNRAGDIASVVAQSKRIYQAIADSCGYHVAFIDRLG